MFEFLSPLFLIGLASAAVPLLIHLSRSRRTKKMRFSTTRFFTDRFLRSYRMSRLKELLLLAFRMMLFALFAVAMSRPLLLPPGHSLLLGQSRSIALVIDNSASMGYVEDGQTLLDRARTAALELIDGLRSGDTASVVLAGRRAAGPEVLFAEPTPALGDVRQAIDTLQLTALGTNLTAAVKAAEGIVGSSSAESKEIYVLSDLQESGFEARTAETTASDAEAMVFLVKVQPRGRENLAVTAVQYATTRPMVGAPFTVRPHVLNGGRRTRECDVSLYIDGEKVGQRHLPQLQAGRWAVPRFHHTFAKGGWHSGCVEVQDPVLEIDNRRHFAFNVLEHVNVLAVNGAPSQVARLDELFFLKTALAAAPEGQSPLHLDVIAPAGLAQTELTKYRTVFLANVASLPAAAVEALESFVDRGGSLLVFLGDRVEKEFYNRAFASPARLHGGLLPGRLVAIEGNPAAMQEDAYVTEVDFTHPALASFDAPQSAPLTGLTLKALWTIEPGTSPVLMRVNSGSPLLLEKPFGKGHVLLFASSCDRDWTSFPVRPAYLPWLYRTIGYLAQEPLGRQPFYTTGDVVPVAVSASEGSPQVLVRTPDQTIRQAMPGTDAAARLVFADTARPGVYAMFTAGRETQAERFVVNVEGSESNLTYLDEVLGEQPTDQEFSTPAEKIAAGFRERLGSRMPTYYVDSPEKVADFSVTARRGIKLWDLLLGLALVVALVEPWLANRISLRHYASPAAAEEATRMPTLAAFEGTP